MSNWVSQVTGLIKKKKWNGQDLFCLSCKAHTISTVSESAMSDVAEKHSLTASLSFPSVLVKIPSFYSFPDWSGFFFSCPLVSSLKVTLQWSHKIHRKAHTSYLLNQDSFFVLDRSDSADNVTCWYFKVASLLKMRFVQRVERDFFFF